MKLFTTRQIATLDRLTIEKEPVADIDLMERAARALSGWLLKELPGWAKLQVLAGAGNNGGDALAVARHWCESGRVAEVYLLDSGKPLSPSAEINRQRLLRQGKALLQTIVSETDFPAADRETVILDGLFGSGLSRPLAGLAAALVCHLNASGKRIISVDIPSGLMGEDNTGNPAENIIRASTTLTLQFPKLSFLFPENEPFVGKWEVLPIGLLPEAIEQTPSPWQITGPETVAGMLPRRSRFSHKGTFGHALLIAGSYGKMGAAVLASRAVLRAGAGLLTTHVPHTGYKIIHTAVPEAMCSIDPSDLMFTEFPPLENFSAVGVGPGIGVKRNCQRGLLALIEQSQRPLVIDADALNILAENREWLTKVPPQSILTPHPGEFRRLAGETENSWQRLLLLQKMASDYQLVMVLKGAFTAVALPGGEVCFNPTGNPGMATAGSGDVLTGIILGLLAQGVSPANAAIAGVYLHGLAGDLAARDLSQPALTAGALTQYLGKAFLEIYSGKEREF